MLHNIGFHLLSLSASRVPIFQHATSPPMHRREASAAFSTQCFATPPPHRFQALLLNISFSATTYVQSQPQAAACFDPVDRDALRYANHRSMVTVVLGNSIYICFICTRLFIFVRLKMLRMAGGGLHCTLLHRWLHG